MSFKAISILQSLLRALPFVMSALAVQASDLSPEIQEKKRWIESVEQGDYFYWKRVIDRRENPGEWTPPSSYYVPRVIIDGGESHYFRDAADEGSVSQKAIDFAWAYALERNTHALLVLHKGVNVAERYAPGYHRGSLVNARSMTKTLMGMLYGVAIAEGAINSIDDPISLYIEEWQSDPRGKVTLRQYLNNVSGLEFPFTNEPGSKPSRLTNGARVDDAALSYELAEPPGSQFILHNANTQILGIALQRATGVTYEAYLSQKIWIPLGASRAVMRQDRIGGSVVTYCCLQGSATDWIRVGNLLMNDGMDEWSSRILPEGWVAEMLKASVANPNYGLHIWRGAPFAPRRSYAPAFEWADYNTQSEPFRAEDIYFLDGGAKTRVWIIPSLDLIIARLGNSPEKGVEFDEAFIPNTIIDGIRK